MFPGKILHLKMLWNVPLKESQKLTLQEETDRSFQKKQKTYLISW